MSLRTLTDLIAGTSPAITIGIISYAFYKLKGLAKRLAGAALALLIFGLAFLAISKQAYTPSDLYNEAVAFVKEVLPKSDGVTKTEPVRLPLESHGPTPQEANEGHFRPLLVGDELSSTQEGSVQYGAIFLMEELDHLGRAQGAHIRVSDHQEPGSNGIKRPGKITNDPVGWRNFKENGYWINDRTHLVGYQFSGINNDVRNLVTASSYLNRGTDGKGTDEQNPDSMLFYEQALDNWVALHPNYAIDYFVKPIYDGDNLVPSHIYMQWVGIDPVGKTIAIFTGGYAKEGAENTHYVVLENKRLNSKTPYNQ